MTEAEQLAQLALINGGVKAIQRLAIGEQTPETLAEARRIAAIVNLACLRLETWMAALDVIEKAKA